MAVDADDEDPVGERSTHPGDVAAADDLQPQEVPRQEPTGDHRRAHGEDHADRGHDAGDAAAHPAEDGDDEGREREHTEDDGRDLVHVAHPLGPVGVVFEPQPRARSGEHGHRERGEHEQHPDRDSPRVALGHGGSVDLGRQAQGQVWGGEWGG